MIQGPVTLPTPLATLVSKALQLCELTLLNNNVFYPFAAVYENGDIGCLFAEEMEQRSTETQLIEQLQWRIIDATTHSTSYSILVYAASVQTEKNRPMDAIAVNTSTPNGDELLLLYPYYRVGGKIVVSPPINTSPE